MGTGVREKLAQAIHEAYRIEQEGNKPPDDPAMQPWARLREDLKESNRQQADQIPEKLKVIGYGIRSVEDREPTKQKLTAEEMETLSRMEHDRWMTDKIKAGWSYAPPPRNDEEKTHPCLVPWEELPEAEKDKDRQAVRQIPGLLARMGFEISKLDLLEGG
jgi:hypothetical protein